VRVRVGSRIQVDRLLAFDLARRPELQARVFGVAVQLHSTRRRSQRRLHADPRVGAGRRREERERALLLEDRRLATRAMPRHERRERRVGPRTDRREPLVHLFAVGHVPTVEGLAVRRDLVPTEEDAAMVGELAAGALRDRGFARGVEHVQERLVGLEAPLLRRRIVRRHVARDEPARAEDVERLARSLAEGDVALRPEGSGAAQGEHGEQRAVHRRHAMGARRASRGS
jgi:hypothetical protein